VLKLPGEGGACAGRLSVLRVADRSVVSHLSATSPLRLVASRLRGGRASLPAAYLSVVTLGGGLVDGDAIHLEVKVGADAALVLTTQASTKVFRGAASQALVADVDGLLVLAPEPVACFREARYAQETRVSLGPRASVVVVDGFTSGRAAYGDRWDFARLSLVTTLLRSGRTTLRDATLLDRDALPIAPRFGEMEALLTIVAEGPHLVPFLGDVLAPLPPTRDLVVAPSPLGECGAVVRIAARRPAVAAAEVRRRLRNLADILGGDPWAGRR
jgi:urease accessory protein